MVCFYSAEVHQERMFASEELWHISVLGLAIRERGNSQVNIFEIFLILLFNLNFKFLTGLLALHTVFVGEHNRIALELSDLNPHWSDEKLYQETRRIIGAMFQHITYREFLPLVLGKEVCNLFDLELLPSGFFTRYDPKVNPTIANCKPANHF